jgi:hypothetical protein
MPRSPDSNALALKRKLQQADSQSEPTSKRHHLQGYDPKASTDGGRWAIQQSTTRYR